MPCFIAVTLAATLSHAGPPARGYINRDGLSQVLEAREADRPNARAVLKQGSATAFVPLTPDEIMAAPCVPLGPKAAPSSPTAQARP